MLKYHLKAIRIFLEFQERMLQGCKESAVMLKDYVETVRNYRLLLKTS